MDKGTIKRIIIWSIFLIIFLSLTILGIVKFYQGYGTYGSIRKELLPIVNNFNSSNKIKNNEATIKVKINNDEIVISYIDDSVDVDYRFKYNTTAGMTLLSLKYDVFYSESAREVVESMIEAVSMYNNNPEGEVFNKYKFNDFYNTNTKQGVQISNNNKYIKVDININENIIKNLDNVVLNPTEVIYITADDILSLNDTLNKNNEFDYVKKNTWIHIIKEDNMYNLYASNKKNDINTLYESVLSVVSLLNSKLYDELVSSNIKFDKNIKKNNYSLEINATFDTKENYDNIIKLSFKK